MGRKPNEYNSVRSTAERTRVQSFVRKGDGTLLVSSEVAGTLTAGTGSLVHVRRRMHLAADGVIRK